LLALSYQLSNEQFIENFLHSFSFENFINSLESIQSPQTQLRYIQNVASIFQSNSFESQSFSSAPYLTQFSNFILTRAYQYPERCTFYFRILESLLLKQAVINYLFESDQFFNFILFILFDGSSDHLHFVENFISYFSIDEQRSLYFAIIKCPNFSPSICQTIYSLVSNSNQYLDNFTQIFHFLKMMLNHLVIFFQTSFQF
jgi:hypothetical protein